MNTDEAKHSHLSENDLQEYAHDPSSEGLERQRQHLENCAECRLNAQKMMHAQAIVRQQLQAIFRDPQKDESRKLLRQRMREVAIAESIRQKKLQHLPVPDGQIPWYGNIPWKSFFQPALSWFLIIPLTALFVALLFNCFSL